MQDSTMALLKLYEQGGFEIDSEFRDLPDHVAVELEFLCLLIFQLNQARAMGDEEALHAVEVLRTAFMIGRWLGPFILALHDHAECEFYRELAEFTELFVRLEGQRQDSVTRH
jgi:TorA maturation chaperone TorD